MLRLDLTVTRSPVVPVRSSFANQFCVPDSPFIKKESLIWWHRQQSVDTEHGVIVDVEPDRHQFTALPHPTYFENATVLL
ncbi:hypothetical protein EMIT0P291_310043 [Pseudomonas sp. IT-P291]